VDNVDTEEMDWGSELRQILVSPNCVFDASLVPETCLDRFVDLKGFTQQVYGESGYRTSRKAHGIERQVA
jgi:hypothetical protein